MRVGSSSFVGKLRYLIGCFFRALPFQGAPIVCVWALPLFGDFSACTFPSAHVLRRVPGLWWLFLCFVRLWEFTYMASSPFLSCGLHPVHLFGVFRSARVAGSQSGGRR